MQQGNGDPQRVLPHSLDAEKAILGTILLHAEAFDQAAEILAKEDFYHEGHATIFEAMAALSATSRPIDSVTIGDELKRANTLEAVGGMSYLAALMQGAPLSSNVEQYASIVKERSLKRRMIHVANDLLVRSFAGEETAPELLESAEKGFFDIGQERVRSGFIGLADLLGETYQQIQAASQRDELITGVPTGFQDLDKMTSGLQNSDMIVLAARPGLGKSSLALNIAQHACIQAGKTVGVFSLEMSSPQLVTRLLCSEARVDNHKVRSGYLSKADWSALAKAMGRLSQGRMFIDDTPGLTPLEMRSKSRRLQAREGLDLLIIDYMQLMSGGSGRQRQENRQQEISYISRSMKLLAKELNIPIIALSQLSRAPEQRRGDHRPQLSDLRESGSIEQDADMVMFIYRDDKYRKDDDDEQDAVDGVAEIIIGKQRNGPTGTVELVFLEQYTQFVNLDRAHEGYEY